MTEQEVLDFVEENDVKFIRLAFVDLFGTSPSCPRSSTAH